MPSSNVTALLGEWEAYRIGVVPRFPAGQHGPKPEVWIELVRESGPFCLLGLCPGPAASVSSALNRMIVQKRTLGWASPWPSNRANRRSGDVCAAFMMRMPVGRRTQRRRRRLRIPALRPLWNRHRLPPDG